ncbi:MAG: hypothetical protein AMXMBFR4_22610 [Candidatus Hydrogenedentota bacterium]
MTISWKTIVAAVAVSALAAAGAGCATRSGKQVGLADSGTSAKTGSDTTRDRRQEAGEGRKDARAAKAKKARISIERASASLGDLIREVGEQAGGNVVLMNGVESRAVIGVDLKKATLPETVARLATSGGLNVEDHPRYFFLYPPGYEALTELSLRGRMDPKYANIETDIVFGSGLRLYTTLTWMSHAMDLSIVADNAIADARCGELALQGVSLEHAIEALLKSARVSSFDIDSTDEYIFLYTPENSSPHDSLLEQETLTPAQKAWLDKRINLYLPEMPQPGQPLRMRSTATKLRAVLPALSQQLGVRVVAEKGLEEYPVNPFCLHGVRIRTALNLLIRQWLEPNYGCQILEDRVLIRRR